MESTPFIYLFETFGGYYIYDVNTDAIIRTKESVYSLLKNNSSECTVPGALKNCNISDYANIVRLKSAGYLSSNRISEITHPADETLLYALENKIPMLSLQVTQNCNLRCDCCAYSGNYENRKHTTKRMRFETAMKGIDFLISHSSECSRICLAFYGGEPLLEFGLIKKCILYAKEHAEGKKLEITLTVNGTLLTESIINYFQEYDIKLMISLDGPKEIHDKNRVFSANGKGSFETIMGNLKVIRDKYPEYFKKLSFNMVVDPENDMTCLDKFISDDEILSDSLFLTSTINENYLRPKTDVYEDFMIKRKYEKFKVYLSKLGKMDVRYVSRLAANDYDDLKRKMVDKRKPETALPPKAHHGGPCIPGARRLFMDVDGNFFPCERVNEASEIMRIGDVETGFDIEKVRRLLNIGRISQESCKNCWAFRYCNLCAACADVHSDLSLEKKTLFCENVRRKTENMFKDYCVLKELGHSFEQEYA